jgi:hypothetical protein
LYEATTTSYSRKLTYEAVVGLAASSALGLGTLFTLLWTGAPHRA